MNRYLNHLQDRFSKTVAVLAILTLAGCEVGSQTKGKSPFRPAVAGNSGVSSGNVSGEVGTPVSITVTIKDKNGFGIRNVIPTVTAVNSLGNSTGITSGGCSITDTKGNSTCTLQSSLKGLRTVKVLTPVQLTGGTIDFFQVPRSLVFTVQPAATAISSTTNLTPSVTVKDRAGVAMANAGTVEMALTIPGLSILSGTKNITVDADGIAAYTDLKIDLAGTYTFTASLFDTTAGTITAASSSFAVTAGAASKLSFSVNPTASVATGEVFALQPVVIQTDLAGNPVTTDNSCIVTLQLAGGAELGDTLAGSTLSKTMIAGVADFVGQNLRVNRIGLTNTPITTYQLRAVPSGTCAPIASNGPFLSGQFTVTLAGLPALLVLVQAPSTAALNQTWANQPIVGILDVNGSPVTGDNTTRVIMANTTASSGTLVGSTSVAANAGRVTYSGLKIIGSSATLAKTYTYSFTGVNPGLTIAGTTTSQRITANGLVPAALEFLVQPSNVAVLEAIPAIQVRVVDAEGFFCFNDNSSSIRVAYDNTIIGVGGNMRKGAGTLAALPTVSLFPGVTAAQTVVNGVATISGLNFPDAGAKILRASFTANLGTVADSGHVLSSTFAVSEHANTSDHLVFSQIPLDTDGSGSGAWTQQPIVLVKDAFGNTMTDDNSTEVTLECVSPLSCATAGLTGGTTTIRVTSGEAQFTGLHMNTTTDPVAGVTIKATATSLPNPSVTAPGFQENNP